MAGFFRRGRIGDMKTAIGLTCIGISFTLLGFFAWLAAAVVRDFGWATCLRAMLREPRAVVLLDGSLLLAIAFLGCGVFALIREGKQHSQPTLE